MFGTNTGSCETYFYDTYAWQTFGVESGQCPSRASTIVDFAAPVADRSTAETRTRGPV